MLLKSASVLSIIISILIVGCVFGTEKPVQEKDSKDEDPKITSNVTIETFCLNQTNFPKEELKKYEQDPDKEASEDFYCYWLCVLISEGIIKEDGSINIKLLKEKIDEDADMNIKCFEKIPQVTECTDMGYFDDCMKNDDYYSDT